MRQVSRKKTAVLCFTGRGERTAQRIGAFFGTENCEIRCKRSFREPLKEREAGEPGSGRAGFAEKDGETVKTWSGTLGEWTGEHFHTCDLLIYVGATGIAVRAIAPFLESKTTDPAVLCVDEAASFVISLVSGHIGGANECAAALAQALHAVPVITTATDINGKFAVDVFARRNGLAISDMKLAKRISAAILEGREVGFESEFPILPGKEEGETGGRSQRSAYLPPGLTGVENPSSGLAIHVGIRRGKPVCSGDGIGEDPNTEGGGGETGAGNKKDILYLTPGIVTVGAGCRRDADPAALSAFLKELLDKEGIAPEAVAKVCSIDLKKDEKAILALAQEYGVPFHTYTAQELEAVPGTFSASEFVKKTVGTDNVCERSALLGSGMGTLLCPKMAGNKMTLALAAGDWRGYFE